MAKKTMPDTIQSRPIETADEYFLSPSAPTAKKARKGRKVQFGTTLQPELIERLQNTAAATGTAVTDIVTAALQRILTEIEREHNDGRPFPTRPRESLRL